AGGGRPEDLHCIRRGRGGCARCGRKVQRPGHKQARRCDPGHTRISRWEHLCEDRKSPVRVWKLNFVSDALPMVSSRHVHLAQKRPSSNALDERPSPYLKPAREQQLSYEDMSSSSNLLLGRPNRCSALRFLSLSVKFDALQLQRCPGFSDGRSFV